MSSKQRNDAFDGLRAIAIVAVVIYHANQAWLPGGFFGVTVFFVLSGYLITTLLLAGPIGEKLERIKKKYGLFSYA